MQWNGFGENCRLWFGERDPVAAAVYGLCFNQMVSLAFVESSSRQKFIVSFFVLKKRQNFGGEKCCVHKKLDMTVICSACSSHCHYRYSYSSLGHKKLFFTWPQKIILHLATNYSPLGHKLFSTWPQKIILHLATNYSPLGHKLFSTWPQKNKSK